MTKPRKNKFTDYLTVEAAKVRCEPGQSVWVEGYCESRRCSHRRSARRVSDLIAEGAAAKRCNLCHRRQRRPLSFYAKRKHIGARRHGKRRTLRGTAR
jgi:hypothetical protein